MNYYELKKRIINREPEDDISREWMIERLESHCRWKFDKALEFIKDFYPVTEFAGHEDDMKRHRNMITELETVEET